MSEKRSPVEPTLTVGGEAFKVCEEGELIYFTDRGGNNIKYKLFEGSYYFPLYDINILKQIKTFSVRPEDIFLYSYPRTGTHWTFEMVGMLLNGKAETIQQWKGHTSLEFHTSEELSTLPSPRFLNTHMKLPDGPAEVKEKNCKIIYCLRDPRDVIVSLYCLFSEGDLYYETIGTFEDFFYLFVEGKVECGGIFEHYRQSGSFFDENPDIPVHFPIYEEMHKNPVLEVQKLSDFLGMKRNDELCQTIADKCIFSRMVVDKDSHALKLNGKNVLYRKGVVGDWKNWFTDDMLEEYFRVYNEKLTGSRFYNLYAGQEK